MAHRQSSFLLPSVVLAGLFGIFAAYGVLRMLGDHGVGMFAQAHSEQQPTERVETQEPAGLSEAERETCLRIINQLTAAGVILKIEHPAQFPHVWVGPEFMALSFDDKRSVVEVVQNYYGERLVVLKDNLTGRRIGSYSVELGLEL